MLQKIKSSLEPDPIISYSVTNLSKTLKPIKYVDNIIIKTEKNNMSDCYVEPVADPIVTPEAIDENFDNKMNTPALRRSSRNNKAQPTKYGNKTQNTAAVISNFTSIFFS